MNRSHLSVALLALGVAVIAACVAQDDVTRKPCSTDADCAAGQKCLETEVELACVNVGGDVTYERDAKQLLNTRCAGCHSPPSYLSGVTGFRLDQYDDEDGVLGAHSMRDRILARAVTAAYRLDAIDQSTLSEQELSELLQSVMPPRAPLPEAEREVLRAWVYAGAPRGEAVQGSDAGSTDAGTGGDAGTVSDGGADDAGTSSDAGTGADAGTTDPCSGSTPATFTQVKSDVFQGNCTGCHGNSGGMTVTDYADVVNVAAQHSNANGMLRVKPGDPMNSFLYRRIRTDLLPAGVDHMPKGGTPLVQAKTDIVLGWICAGAQNN